MEIVKLLCEDTPQTIFPKRNIGFLRKGYEANFLVLKGDPLKNLKNLKRIKLRVKNGKIVRL